MCRQNRVKDMQWTPDLREPVRAMKCERRNNQTSTVRACSAALHRIEACYRGSERKFEVICNFHSIINTEMSFFAILENLVGLYGRDKLWNLGFNLLHRFNMHVSKWNGTYKKTKVFICFLWWNLYMIRYEAILLKKAANRFSFLLLFVKQSCLRWKGYLGDLRALYKNI